MLANQQVVAGTRFASTQMTARERLCGEAGMGGDLARVIRWDQVRWSA